MKTNYMILYKDMEVFCKVPGVFAPKIPRGVFVSIVSPLKHEAVEKKRSRLVAINAVFVVLNRVRVYPLVN